MHTIYAVGSFRLRVGDVARMTLGVNDPSHGTGRGAVGLAHPRVATVGVRT
jgi:hypothetical protein